MEQSFKPEVIRSEIAETAWLSPFCHVIDSTLGTNAKVYKDCWIVKTMMEENTFTGDGTKLDNCSLSAFSRAGKYNHLYYTKLGRHTYTGQDTIIMHTEIGSFCSVSWGVTIGAGEHDFKRVTSHAFLYNSYDRLNDGIDCYDRFEKDCEVGNDVWIGANVTVLRGVIIGSGAVVGANSIVTKDVPPYAIVAGNPAKIIKYRFNEDIIARLLKLEWWNLKDETIKQYCSLFAGQPDHKILDEIEAVIRSEKGKSI